MQTPNQDTEGVRSACEELLIREKLPTFYRAQLLVYKAATEKEGEYERIRERLEDAKYWVLDLKVANLARAEGEQTGTDERERVEMLEAVFDGRLEGLNRVDPRGDEARREFERKLEVTKEGIASRRVSGRVENERASK